MRILVITAHDAVNLSVENVVRELVRRGHLVDIFAKRMESRHIRMFADLPIKIRPVSKLKNEIIKDYDCAFCPMDSVGDLIFNDIYIFSYNFIFSNRWTTPGGDFMFVQTENRPVIQWEDCARMAVGSPKNDHPKLQTGPNRSFLFIDTGHFPYSLEGKTQLAEMILKIGRRFPDRKLIVKPRWLINEINDIHISRIHLYSVIDSLCGGNLPNNIVLLNEHLDMQDLIDNADVVITPGSTAYFEAALRGKKILIIDGLASGDSIDARKETIWNPQLDIMRETGCVVNYRDVLDYLPDGLSCNEDHLNHIATYRGNVSKAIAEVMEYVYWSFLFFGKFPAINSYSLENYKEEMKAEASISFALLKKRRMKNQALRIARRFDWVTAKLDYSEWIETLNSTYDKYTTSYDGLKSLKKDLETKLKQLWLKSAEKMNTDSIDQSVLFKAMYELGKADEIVNMPAETVLCKGAYNYYLAKYSSNNSVKIQCFIEYLDDVASRPFTMYPQDSAAYQKDAYNYLFNIYDGNNLSTDDILRLYLSIYEMHLERYVTFKNRKKIHNCLPKIAQELLPLYSDKAIEALTIYTQYEKLYNIQELRNKIARLEKENRAIRSWKLYRFCNMLHQLKLLSQKGFHCLREKGLVYALRRCKELLSDIIAKFKKRLSEKSVYRIYHTYKTKVMTGYSLYSNFTKKYGETARLLLSCNGTGDAYLIGMIYRAYKNKYVNKDVTTVLAVYEKTGEQIARNFFGIDPVEPFSFDDFKWLWNLLMFDTKQVTHLESIHYHNVYRHTLILQYLDGLHGFNIASELLAFLDIDAADMDMPTIKGDKAYLEKLFSTYKLIPGKTVLLAPYAKSFRFVPKKVWIKLAHCLSSKGYIVCTNSVGAKEPAIPETVPILVPHSQAVPFLEIAGACIGLRSGFLDIVSSARCLKIAIYNESKFSWGQVGDSNEIFFLSEMYNQPKQFDLVWHANDEESFLDKIVALITDELS